MPLRFDVHEFDEVTSTNDVVKQAASEGAEEGFVACAQRQTAGYGRRGNKWQSEPGSLYMSVLLRPTVEGDSGIGSARMQTLPLVVAVAVRRAVASSLPADVRDEVMVKWPNDLVAGLPCEGAFRKLCGISVESKSGAVCVGVGVNVSRAPVTPLYGQRETSQGAGKNIPAYMSDLAPEGEYPTVPQVREAILGELAKAYDAWLDAGFAPSCPEFNEHSALNGINVRVEDAAILMGEQASQANASPDPECVVEGVVQGVDADGCLLVQPFGGKRPLRVVAGSITI